MIIIIIIIIIIIVIIIISSKMYFGNLKRQNIHLFIFFLHLNQMITHDALETYDRHYYSFKILLRSRFPEI